MRRRGFIDGPIFVYQSVDLPGKALAYLAKNDITDYQLAYAALGVTETENTVAALTKHLTEKNRV